MKSISEALSPLSQTEPAKLFCSVPGHGEYQGFVCVVAGQEIKSQCDKCAAEELKAEVERIAEENELARRVAKNEGLFKMSCIPPRFAKKSFKMVTCL